MADLASLIHASLTAGGETAEAQAFGRLLAKALAIELDQHTVREAKGDFSGFLGRVRRRRAITIAPHRRTKDAVIVISVEELGKALGAAAADLDQSPTADAHDPMLMLAAVDRLPEVGEADAVIPTNSRRREPVLNLD
jgi:hypothetical protein